MTRLEDLLRTGLSHEAARAPQLDMAAAALARARGIRSRRRTAGAAAAAATVVAIGLPLAGQLHWPEPESSVPAGTAQSPAPTRRPTGSASSTTPSATPTAPLRLRLAASPLLRDEDVNPLGAASRLALSPSASLAQGYEELVCLPRLTTAAATRLGLGAWFSQGSEQFYEGALELPSTTGATGLVDDQRRLPTGCSPTVRSISTVREPEAVRVAGADEALVWTVERIRPAGADGDFAAVAMARRANIVVILTFRGAADPTGGTWAAYATATLTTALDRAIA